MKISEKVIVFVTSKDREGKTLKTKDGKPFKKFSTNFSSKNDDGTYTNKSMEVRFNRENIPESATKKMTDNKCYVLDVKNGWIGVRSYKNEENEERKVFYLWIDEASVTEAKEIQQSSKNGDLPF